MARRVFSVIDFFAVDSSPATEFRRILHRLLDRSAEAELKSVLVTSSTISEGKSTVCSLLSLTAARRGLKTLLLDADLRRPSLHRLFNLPREDGFSEVLAEGRSVKEVAQRSVVNGLDIITAGKPYPQPAEIFESQAIGRLVEEAKFYYDLVLLDSAPIIPVSDPMILADEVDGVVLVIKAGQTQREVVGRAAEIMGSTGAPLLGVVLNNVGHILPAHYDYEYYGYRYDQTPPAARKRNAAKRGRKEPAAPPDTAPKTEDRENSATGKLPRQ
jgi:capsular exopolysaccharide synthesis family protein